MTNKTILSQLKQPVYQRVTAGLFGNEVEIFYYGAEVYAIYQGKRLAFNEWPGKLYDYLAADMQKHPLAVEAMDELGVTDFRDRLWIYARCRFGSFDGKPDISADGRVLHTEYYDCGLRGECSFEGRICSHMKVEQGYLTPREIDIMRLAAEDFMNKEIAYKLNISVKTVPVHKRNMLRKIGGRRNGDIIRFAVEHNIISNKQA